ncbi:MAG TPA: phospholipid carrier-dependent glycosyltransferase [Chloroflexota bacterium]
MSRPTRSHERRAWLGCLALLVAAALRLTSLDQPPARYADEVDYALDARGQFAGSPAVLATLPPPPPGVATLAGDLTWWHPPLAKLLIGRGQAGAGDDPLGWRIAPALCGVLGVAVAYALAWQLLRSAWWAALAALLLASDGLHVVQSRMAMLDVFLATFAGGGVLCLVLAWRARHSGRRSAFLVLAGLFFGAALASKWAALLLLLPAALAAAEVARRAMGWKAALRTLAVLALVPLAVYLASYGEWFVRRGPDVAGFVRLQAAMLDYGRGFQRPNPYASPAASWPLLLRPFRYYYAPQGAPVKTERQILALGNPALWWSWLGLAPIALWAAARQRSAAAGLAVGGYLCCWAPWLLVGRTTFLYYLLPGVPFMAVGAAAACHALRPRLGRALGLGLAAAAGGLALAFAPHWLGLSIPVAWSHSLGWLSGWR